MSYRALYRTYRPREFKDVVGQDHIVLTLQNVIASDKVRHAYLFAGPRGTGKTSVAHVFARAINKTASGNIIVDDLDIIEIDAASNNGVADVRTLIESSSYAPTQAKYKVYIIDEVHMLTKGAWNALLKTLEEPPKHVVFILATTEPHKIPTTILSRTQRFNFKRIDNETIKKQLRNVLGQEKIDFDEESIKFIAELSQGGMRDALTISDQASAFGNGSISFETIAQVFGVVSTSHQIQILNFAHEGKTRELMKLVNELIDNGADIERISLSLLGIVKDFIIYAKAHDVSLIQNITLEECKHLSMSVPYAYEVVEILMKLITDLRFTEVPKQSFELAILKMSRSKDTHQVAAYVEPEKEDIFKTTSFSTKIVQPVEVPVKQEEVVVQEVIATPASALVDEEENLFDLVSDKMQEETQLLEISEDVISTTEFSVTEQISAAPIITEEVKQEEVVQEVIEDKKEEPVDLLKLFEIDSTSTATHNLSRQAKHSNETILNLFLLSSRDKLNENKIAWANLIKLASASKYLSLVSSLNETKAAAAGDNFILVVSEKENVASDLFKEFNSSDLIELSKDVFGLPTWIYTISKTQFDEVKNLYQRLQVNNELPNPSAVIKPTLQPKEKNEVEKFGTSVFGDLFKD